MGKDEILFAELENITNKCIKELTAYKEDKAKLLEESKIIAKRLEKDGYTSHAVNGILFNVLQCINIEFVIELIVERSNS